ncbi:outer membrane protein assembly factor BamA [Candidatus Babeliales bacterium]|nr:outer membrane protein assembly factor BamA [Candidatus Babeliales bacterium]
MNIKLHKKSFFILFFAVFSFICHSNLLPDSALDSISKNNDNVSKEKIINTIAVSGNKHIKDQVILNRLPYKIGQPFDKTKSNIAINNVYSLGFFRQIILEKEITSDNKINLFITVEEKKLLENLEFTGNKAIRTKKIKEDLKLEKLPTIDEEGLQKICNGIKKIYSEENYHNTKITTEVIPNKENPEKAKALFTIQDGPKSKIKRVFFKGNDHIESRKLSEIISSRENWILSFLDSAGQYNPDDLEMDKHRIEYFYKDHGYIMATVADAEVEFSKDQTDILITFHIKEGDLFTIKKINISSDEEFKEQELLKNITLEEDKPYSQSKLIETINNLKSLYGQKGYIYADIYPQIKPDEQTNQVEIDFYAEKGKKLRVNRINVTGNIVTRDNVIRRQIDLKEGEIITSKKLNESKSNVEYLSFFERDGVNWKIHRLTDDTADLEMNVKESKTGSLQVGINYGSDPQNPRPSLKGNINLEKKNLFGYGWDTGFMIQANRHSLQKLQAHFFDPSIFDSTVSGNINFYRRWAEYEQWSNVNATPKEISTGGNIAFGFQLPAIDKKLQLLLEFGVEDISFKRKIYATTQQQILQPIIDRTFQEGTLSYLGLDLVKDTRNHQIYPNKGYKLMFNTKTAFPFINQQYSFFKTELDASWYNALIGEDSLVLVLHGKTGAVTSLGGTIKKNDQKKIIPYKELFHMGGQNTVRGFVWGSIGPAWITGDPLGAKYAVQFNAELVFPLIPDYSMKGHFFYDAGAGWDTPKYTGSEKQYLKRDKFDLRHSVGFGLNLTKPMPAKIDWGYKLDRKKSAGESPSEFHLSMNYAW